jgi:hypothetical protein
MALSLKRNEQLISMLSVRTAACSSWKCPNKVS